MYPICFQPAIAGIDIVHMDIDSDAVINAILCLKDFFFIITFPFYRYKLF